MADQKVHVSTIGKDLNADFFRSLVESSPDVIVVLDKKGIIKYSNPSIRDVLGYDPAEVIGRLYSDFVHPEDRFRTCDSPAFAPIGACLFPAGHGAEFRFRHKDGSWRHLETVAGTIYEDRRIGGVTVTARDLNGRASSRRNASHRAAEARNLAEEIDVLARISRVVNLSTDLGEVFDGIAECVNQFFPSDAVAIGTLVGEPAESLISYASGIGSYNRGVQDPVPLEGTLTAEVTKFQKSVILHAETEKQISEKYPYLVSAFQQGMKSWLASPLINQGKSIGALLVVSLQPRAFSAKHQALLERIGQQIAGAVGNGVVERRLRQEEERFRSLIEASHDIVATVDKNGVFTFASPSVEGVLGYAVEEFVGRSAHDFYHPEDKDAGARAFSRTRNDGPYEPTRSFRFRHKDGSYRVLEAAASQLSSEQSMPGLMVTIRDITESQRAQQELDRFFSLSSDLLAFISFEGYFTRVSPSFEKVLGFSSEELTSTPLLEFVHPDDREATRQARITAQDVGFSQDVVNRYRCKDGSYRWMSWRGTASPEEGLIYGAGRDITQDRLAEEALAEREAKYRELFEESPNPVFLITPDGQLFDGNQAVSDLFGYTREEIFGIELERLMMDPSDRYWAWEEITSQGQIKNQEIRYRHKSGEEIICLVSTTTIRGPDGATLGYQGILQDITTLKEIQKALEKSEELYRSLIDNLSEGVFQTRPNGTYITANPAMAQMLGYDSPEELINSVPDPRSRLFADPAAGAEYLECLLRNGQVSGYELELLRKDDAVIWISVNARVMYNDAGAIDHVLGMVSDITGRKALEQEIAQHTRSLEIANEELKEVDRMKDSFLSIVSHELRTPLTSIKGSAEILLDGDDTEPERRREFLQIINNESDRLTRLINDVLDLAKIESGRMEWGEELLPMSSVIHDSVNGIRSLAIQKNLTVDVDVPKGRPHVRSEHDKLVQVVNNLLSNAIKFSRENGVVRVEVTTQPSPDARGEEVRVAVADTGIGIAIEDFEEIFERFKQAGDDASGRPKGSGLGLPICKQIIEHYGGRIWVESELGKGSTFQFTIPAAR